MGNLLYIIAVILVIGWAIGFIGYSAGGIIHVLLVIALIAVVFRVIQGKRIWFITFYLNLQQLGVIDLFGISDNQSAMPSW